MRRFLIWLAAFIGFAAVIVAVIGFWAYREIHRPGPGPAAQVLVIERGWSVDRIAKELEDSGVVVDAGVFALAVQYFDRTRNLRAGEYNIPAEISVRALVDLLSDGKTVLRQLTIPEGLTSQEVVALLAQKKDLSGEVSPIPAEGTLLPDTYSYALGEERVEVLDRMQRAMQAHVQRLWVARAGGLPLNSPDEAVVLASIIEKETGQAGERGKVAGVFINRLRRDMRLQSDPTVIYAITKGAGALGRRLTRKDLRTKSPYNTYVVKGLPPGPIANPGRAALEAALQPEDTKAIFFVANGKGGHAFSETLAEHNRNVKKWRQFLKKQKVTK